MAKILVVDADVKFAHTLIDAYRVYRHEVFYRADGISGLSFARSQNIDILILNVDLPKLGGIDICKRLRADNVDAAIIFVSRERSIETLQKAMSEGGDGFMTMPFTPAELMIRTQALLHRPPQTKQAQRWRNLHLNDHNRVLKVSGHELQLTRREYRLLTHMLQYPAQTHHRLELVRSITDPGKRVDENCIDAHICNLRRRLSKVNATRLIETVYGIGYKINTTLLEGLEVNSYTHNQIIS